MDLNNYETKVTNLTNMISRRREFESVYGLGIKDETITHINERVKANPRYRVYIEERIQYMQPTPTAPKMIARRVLVRLATGTITAEGFVIDSYIYDNMFDSTLLIPFLVKHYKSVYLRDEVDGDMYQRDGFVPFKRVLGREPGKPLPLDEEGYCAHIESLGLVSGYHQSLSRKELMLKINELYGEGHSELREQLRRGEAMLCKWVRDDFEVYFITAQNAASELYMDRIHMPTFDKEKYLAVLSDVFELCDAGWFGCEITVRSEEELEAITERYPEMTILGTFYESNATILANK